MVKNVENEGGVPMKDRGAERAKEVLVRKARERKTSFLAVS